MKIFLSNSSSSCRRDFSFSNEHKHKTFKNPKSQNKRNNFVSNTPWKLYESFFVSSGINRFLNSLKKIYCEKSTRYADKTKLFFNQRSDSNVQKLPIVPFDLTYFAQSILPQSLWIQDHRFQAFFVKIWRASVRKWGKRFSVNTLKWFLNVFDCYSDAHNDSVIL